MAPTVFVETLSRGNLCCATDTNINPTMHLHSQFSLRQPVPLTSARGLITRGFSHLRQHYSVPGLCFIRYKSSVTTVVEAPVYTANPFNGTNNSAEIGVATRHSIPKVVTLILVNALPFCICGI